MTSADTFRGALLLGALGMTMSCAHVQTHAEVAITTPAQLCQDATLGVDRFCMPSRRIEALLRDRPMKMLLVGAPRHGVTRPKTMALTFPEEGLIIHAKWKEARHNAVGVNNDPRKELAAAALQKLFLDEDEYVVPPTVGRCLPLDEYAAVVHPAAPTFDKTGCVFGVFSYWVENVGELGVLDKARFATSAPYRAALANMNLLTYLIAHGDTRPSNFIISKDRDDPRALSIDNGLAFGGFTNPRTLFSAEWRKIIVPSVARAKIARLARTTRAELDTLAVVAQYQVDDGQLIPVTPTAPINTTQGVRRRDDVIQLGLTREEIDGIAMRMNALAEEVASGRLKEH